MNLIVVIVIVIIQFLKEKYGHQCKWVDGTYKNYIRNSEIRQKQITLMDDVGFVLQMR